MAMVVVAEGHRTQFAAWVAARQQPAAEPTATTARRGRDVFLGAGGCATCHAVRGTSATGTVGPDLTHVGQPVDPGRGGHSATRPADRAEWVSDPHDHQAGRGHAGKPELSREELDAVLAYLGSLR